MLVNSGWVKRTAMQDASVRLAAAQVESSVGRGGKANQVELMVQKSTSHEFLGPQMVVF